MYKNCLKKKKVKRTVDVYLSFAEGVIFVPMNGVNMNGKRYSAILQMHNGNTSFDGGRHSPPVVVILVD